jgi:hypothetical protein
MLITLPVISRLYRNVEPAIKLITKYQDNEMTTKSSEILGIDLKRMAIHI